MAIRCFAGDNVNFWLQTFKKPQTFRKLKINFRFSKNKTNLGNLISLVNQQQESENFFRTIFQSKENRFFVSRDPASTKIPCFGKFLLLTYWLCCISEIRSMQVSNLLICKNNAENEKLPKKLGLTFKSTK